MWTVEREAPPRSEECDFRRDVSRGEIPKNVPQGLEQEIGGLGPAGSAVVGDGDPRAGAEGEVGGAAEVAEQRGRRPGACGEGVGAKGRRDGGIRVGGREEGTVQLTLLM